MDLTSYTDALRDDLVAAAALGDEDTRRTAAALAAAVEPAARLTLMAALADLAAEVTATCEDRVVEVRLDGRDVRVVVTGTTATGTTAGTAPAAPGPAAPAPERRGPSPEDAGGEVSRVTLRLFEQLKTKAEDAASSQGVSLNSWLSQTVQGALSSYDPGRRAATRDAADGGRPDGAPDAGERAGEDRDDDGDDDGGQTLRGWVQG